MSTPAMAKNFQAKRRGPIQISFEGQCFFLFVAAAYQPLNRKSAGPKFHRYTGILEPTGGKMQSGLKTGSSQPAGIQNPSLAGACVLDPAQGRRAFFSVVMRKHEVPQPQNGNRSDHVNQEKASHTLSSDAYGTSEVADEARGQSSPIHNSGAASLLSCGKLGRNRGKRSGLAPSTRGYNGPVPFTVRDFQPADFETLWRIDQTCFLPGISYSRPELRLYMKRRASFTLVAVSAEPKDAAGIVSAKGAKHSPPKEAGIAGFIVAEAGSRARGHIITIDVIAPARRFGVGSLLLRAAEDRLILAECRTVELETAVDNISALSFYKRQGYTVIRTLPRYYSNGVDALVLEKALL
jgi:ribosomal-protein-alanine N-acetyltransferase